MGAWKVGQIFYRNLIPKPRRAKGGGTTGGAGWGGRLGGQAWGGGKAAEEEDSFGACGRSHSTIPPKFNNNSFVGL